MTSSDDLSFGLIPAGDCAGFIFGVLGTLSSSIMQVQIAQVHEQFCLVYFCSRVIIAAVEMRCSFFVPHFV